MQTIYQYGLCFRAVQRLQLPKGAEILCVQAQHDEPQLWALVDTDAAPEERTIEIFGTGHPVHRDVGVSRRYISTFQTHGGAFVFHAFEYTGV